MAQLAQCVSDKREGKKGRSLRYAAVREDESRDEQVQVASDVTEEYGRMAI